MKNVPHLFPALRASVALVVLFGMAVTAGCKNTHDACYASENPCETDLECLPGQTCDIVACECVPGPGPDTQPLSDTQLLSDLGNDVMIRDTTPLPDAPPSALNPENLATLTGTGLPATCHFVKERGASVAMFDATITARVTTSDAIRLSQSQTQTSDGMFVTDETFWTRDATALYDETYLGQYARTANTPPETALTTGTVIMHLLNISGPQGSLAPIVDARIGPALDGGAHTGATPAIDAFVAGTNAVDVYLADCTF